MGIEWDVITWGGVRGECTFFDWFFCFLFITMELVYGFLEIICKSAGEISYLPLIFPSDDVRT